VMGTIISFLTKNGLTPESREWTACHFNPFGGEYEITKAHKLVRG